MPGEHFFDSNILIYAFAANEPRGDQAELLISTGGVIGVQVLNEFTNVVRKKLSWDWPRIDAALAVIGDFLGTARPLTSGIHAGAVVLARNHSLSFYDALIVAAAIEAKCRILYSEDFQNGQKFGSLVVKNPFVSLPES